jgi:hypothetical protein
VGLIKAIFGDRKARRQRRRKKVVKSAGSAVEDTAEGCTGGCCLDFVVPLAVGAVAGHRVARRSLRPS